ncbi:MAG: hypothetical protein IPN36_11385 [Bacteroidetes bacterium]|nr:hypothetical protein [Bacteroidota bacterium]MBL0098350.1 hypothetical protein [Bacteroidota bacterium]
MYKNHSDSSYRKVEDKSDPKTNEDFNRKKPHPADPNQKDQDPDEGNAEINKKEIDERIAEKAIREPLLDTDLVISGKKTEKEVDPDGIEDTVAF